MSPAGERIVSAVLFVVILLGGFQRDLLILPFIDSTPLERELKVAADRAAPRYPAFLAEVGRRTPANASISLVFRAATGFAPSWYAYFRARYLLPDRNILPVSDIDGTPHPERLDTARYVAAWGVDFSDARFEVVWSGEGGLLARRRP